MPINHIPFLQVQREGRAYILLLPFNAPFDEAHECVLELAGQVLEEKRVRDELMEKAKAQAAEEEAKKIGDTNGTEQS